MSTDAIITSGLRSGSNSPPGKARTSKASFLAWCGLLVLGAFPAVAAALDLLADLRSGLPSDHRQTFSALTGMRLSTASAAQPGLMHYIRLLEIGYAVHEIVFAVLFLTIVAIPLRRRLRWAWFVSWAVLAADVTYTLTFGLHSPTILRQSLIAAIGLPLLLLTLAPSMLAARRQRGHPEL